MNTIETIKLDRVPKGKMPVLHASQYDNGRTHGIDLTNLGEEWKLDGTEKLTINERKVDNNICSMDIENTFEGSSHIEFASFLQMCACAGSNFCELRISKGDVDVGTLNFILEVEPDPTAEGIESESEIRNLKTQIEEITEEVIGEDYYTKTQTDNAIANATEGKADTTYVNEKLAKKADKTDTYTKTQVDNALNTKMDKANPTGTGSLSLNRKANTVVGNNSVAMGNNATASGENSMAIGNGSFANGANSVAMGNGTRALGANQFVFGKHNNDSNYNNFVEIVGKGNAFTRSNARTLDWSGNETLAGDLTYNGNKSLTSEISRLDNRITGLPEAMVFKGTLGVGGTIETLPTASAENEGWMFKCITAGTYAGLTLKVGDTVTCFNPPNTSTYYWDKTGSQDTDTDTWRNIKINGVEKLGNGISSGAVDFEDTANVKFEFDANGNKVRARLDGIYTESDVDDLLDDKADADNTYTKAQVDDIVYGILPDDTASGSVANFETDLALPIKSLEVDVNAVQESGTPTPASPLPISGWSEISLVKCGANLCNQADIVGAYPTKYTVDTDGSIKTVGNLGLADVLWTNKSKVSGALNVVFVSKYQNTGSVGIRPKIFYTDGTSSVIYTTNTQDYSVKTLLTNSSKTVEKIVVDYGTNNPTNFFFEVTLDTSVSTYEPYNGNTEVINLGGTYYGGHLIQDKAGHRQFEVTRGIKLFGDISFSRSNNGGAWGAYLFYAQITDKPNGGVLKCSNYEYVVQSIASMQNEKIVAVSTNKYIYIRDDAYTTVEDFKTANANTQVVYPLATPIIIDLPDGEPIITLNGTNNIYADTGDSTVVFKCSVAEYVANHSGGGGAKSLGGVFLGGSNSGSEEEPTEESEGPKEVTKTPGDEPISKK